MNAYVVINHAATDEGEPSLGHPDGFYTLPSAKLAKEFADKRKDTLAFKYFFSGSPGQALAAAIALFAGGNRATLVYDSPGSWRRTQL